MTVSFPPPASTSYCKVGENVLPLKSMVSGPDPPRATPPHEPSLSTIRFPARSLIALLDTEPSISSNTQSDAPSCAAKVNFTDDDVSGETAAVNDNASPTPFRLMITPALPETVTASVRSRSMAVWESAIRETSGGNSSMI